MILAEQSFRRVVLTSLALLKCKENAFLLMDTKNYFAVMIHALSHIVRLQVSGVIKNKTEKCLFFKCLGKKILWNDI